MEMVHENVIYQNPFLSMRIWQIDKSSDVDECIDTNKKALRKTKEPSWWHYHKEVEFILILHGGMTVYIPDGQIQLIQGDVAILGSSEPHTTQWQPPEKLSYVVFQLDLQKHMDQSSVSNMKYFNETIHPLSRLNYILKENKLVRDQIAQLIISILNETEHREKGYELAVSAMIKNIFLLLVRNDNQVILQYLDSMHERIQPALQYIETHLSDKILIDDVTKQVNLSYFYFIKVFKKTVGMSFTDYVNFKRIKKAEQLLLTEDKSIAEVAELVGISNLGHFYEMFRRFNHCSPKQFKYRLSDSSL